MIAQIVGEMNGGKSKRENCMIIFHFVMSPDVSLQEHKEQKDKKIKEVNAKAPDPNLDQMPDLTIKTFNIVC